MEIKNIFFDFNYLKITNSFNSEAGKLYIKILLVFFKNKKRFNDNIDEFYEKIQESNENSIDFNFNNNISLNLSTSDSSLLLCNNIKKSLTNLTTNNKEVKFYNNIISFYKIKFT